MSEQYHWENGLLLHPPIFPKTSVDYQPLLNADDLSPLEDHLMEHLETVPRDIGYYLPAYRAFIRKHDSKRAVALLELHVETLREIHELVAEIELLQSILGFWQECGYARKELLGHLKTMYAESPHFDRYAGFLGISDPATGIDAFRQLERWLRYDEGRVVYIPSKGVGRVYETNTNFGVVRIRLPDGEQLSFQVEGAARQITSLATDHFLARTVTDRENLRRTAVDDPGELLRQLFTSVGRELQLTELKEMLADIVPDSQWTAWWTGARKDSRLIVGSGSKPVLKWNDSISQVTTEIFSVFQKAPLREKLDMLKKHASRSASLALQMAEVLSEASLSIRASDPSLALEILLSITDMTCCKEVELPFPVDDLLRQPDPGTIVSGIGNRLIRKKAIQLIAGLRDDWPVIFGTLLKTESDTSLLKLLYESLLKENRDDLPAPEVDRAFSHPATCPHFYLWLCRELPARPELKKYATREFLYTLTGLFDDGTFRGHLAALRKCFDPGHAVDYAAATLDAESGRTFLDTLSRVRELEDYRKESVRQKLITLFPELHEQRRNFLFVTRESLDRKLVEYEKLIKKDIPRNAAEIQRTREYGDLRENFEYHEARRQQELLSSRAKTLHDELINARAIEPDTVDTSKISIGTRCLLRPESGAASPVTLTILGPWDSDPDNNVLSYTAAAAESLLNVEKGGKVIFNEADYVVDAIDLWSS